MPPDQKYVEFGRDISNLGDNLNNICRVVENAKLTWAQHSLRLRRSRGQALPKDWDLSSLREIIGDYHKTLADCSRLLEENSEFRKNRNFVYNVDWHIFLQPKVDQLRKRLEFHNSKIAVLLKPLELNLLSDIHNDLAERIDAVHQSVLHLQGLLIPDVEQALSERSVVSNLLAVPADIERKFQAAAEKSHPEIGTRGNFPLQAGADAFVAHLEESTKIFTAGNFLNERTPPPEQYLSLLKCIWIMERLQESDALRNAPKDSQWPGYINQLNEDLSIECQRFTAPSAHRLIAPDLSSQRHADEYSIWLEENVAEYISPHFDTYMEEVLKIPMPISSESLQREMTIYRLDSTKYRLVECVDNRNAPSTHRQEFQMDIDLKTVGLTPIYATPSSRPKALEVLIRSANTRTNPTFCELKHILRLQHLLTGYQVFERYDQAMVTVSFFISGEEKPVEEHGRLQLWLPHPFGRSSASNSGTSTDVASPAHNNSRASITTAMDSVTLSNNRRSSTPSLQSARSPSTITVGGNNRSSPNGRTKSPASQARRASGSFSPTTTTSKTSVNYPSIGSSIYSERSSASVRTNSSSMSRSTVTSVTTISTGTGRARLHEKPSKPLLVILLKSKDASAKLAIVAVQIDDHTKVIRERCECRTSHSQCPISCIERSGGSLLAQRWEADQGLGSWNLAKLGMDQRKDLPEDAWNNVKRVSMKFESMEGEYLVSRSLSPSTA